MKRYDVIALGESLIDFVCAQENGSLKMTGNPGGAPANVLAMLARLGHKTALVSKVGRDAFGGFLRAEFAKAGIDTGYLLSDPQHPTTLAIVQLDAAGNRSFSFYRDRTADVMLSEQELPFAALADTEILHFGSLSLTAEPARSATFAAVRAARAAGALISYDPNLRPPLWRDLDEARALLRRGLEEADLVKISEEEVEFLTGAKEVHQGARLLCGESRATLLAVTRGAGGTLFCSGGLQAEANTFDTACVDTTGAGDASWGAALAWLLEHGAARRALSAAELAEIMDFANGAGSLATTRYGAIPAMPERAEILECIAKTPRLARR